MRVVSYNIWEGGLNHSGPDRRATILQVLEESGADIVALFEACDFTNVLPTWEKKLGMTGALAEARSGYHVAILVRPPLKLISAKGVHTPTFYNTCLSARVESEKGELLVMATHLNPFDPAARLTEARHLAREAYDDRPVLLMGDLNAFSPNDKIDPSVHALSPRVLARHLAAPGATVTGNTTYDTRAIGILEWAGYIDLFRKLHPAEPGWTLPTQTGRPRESANMRLDYLFATKPLADQVRKCEVLRTPASGRASDHYPLVAEFAG